MKKVLISVFATMNVLCYANDAMVCEETPSESVYEHAREQINTAMPGSGRMYYDSLITKASKRRWSFPVSFYATFDNGGFDCTGCSGSLTKTVFGKDPIWVRDIYLFSRLSDDNKVRINNCDARACERGSVPPCFPGVPFGGFRDDLYTTLLAPVKLLIDSSEREFGFIFSPTFRFDLDKNNLLALSLGVNVPLKTLVHSMDLSFECGELFRDGFVPQTTQRETSLKQFHRDFSDVIDFLNRAVFGAQCLSFEGYQRKTGFGDLSVFGMLEFQSVPALNIGLNIVFPTAGKGSGDTVWEPILGNGGAFQFDPFAQILFTGKNPFVNPFVRVAGEISTSFSNNNARAPKVITNPRRQQVQNISGLSAPSFFNSFYVDPFSVSDSCIPLLSGRACLTQKIGNKILLGLGNYSYDLFHFDLRLGLFYDYMHKSEDTFTSNESMTLDCCMTSTLSASSFVDAAAVGRLTEQVSHTVSASFTYKFNNLCELGLIGQFVVLGKNVPRYRTIYVSAVIVF